MKIDASEVKHFLTDDIDDGRLTALVDLAWLRIKARVPRLEERMESRALERLLVAGVIADVVTRAVRNPQGLTQESHTAGPFTRSFSYRDIHVTDIDIRDLMPPSRTAAVGAFDLGLRPWQIP